MMVWLMACRGSAARPGGAVAKLGHRGMSGPMKRRTGLRLLRGPERGEGKRPRWGGKEEGWRLGQEEGWGLVGLAG